MNFVFFTMHKKGDVQLQVLKLRIHAILHLATYNKAKQESFFFAPQGQHTSNYTSSTVNAAIDVAQSK